MKLNTFISGFLAGNITGGAAVYGLLKTGVDKKVIRKVSEALRVINDTFEANTQKEEDEEDEE